MWDTFLGLSTLEQLLPTLNTVLEFYDVKWDLGNISVWIPNCYHEQTKCYGDSKSLITMWNPIEYVPKMSPEQFIPMHI